MTAGKLKTPGGGAGAAGLGERERGRGQSEGRLDYDVVLALRLDRRGCWKWDERAEASGSTWDDHMHNVPY